MTRSAGDGAARQPAPLPDPIEFIRHEHERQIEFCEALETLISVLDLAPVRDQAGKLRGFLIADLPRHIEDEEQDLFPLLKARCGQSGATAEILDQLASEHEDDRELAALIADDLGALHNGHTLADPTRFHYNARTFCELQRRHLIWENRLVLPLAGRQLSAADKADLGQRMTDRRAARHQ